MTERYGFAFSRPVAPEPCKNPSPRNEGAGNAGRSMRPQPRMQNKNEHTSVVTTVTPETPGIPRAMVYDLYRALPGDRACLSPSLAVTRKLDAGVEASGPHDFAVRELALSSAAPSASTHPAPRQ